MFALFYMGHSFISLQLPATGHSMHRFFFNADEMFIFSFHKTRAGVIAKAYKLSRKKNKKCNERRSPINNT